MKILVFLGSVRTSSPPDPERLGERVARACVTLLRQQLGDQAVELIDPLDYQQGPVFKPHFSYHQRHVPADLAELAGKIKAADGYVMVSPEYNHSMSPALAHLLNHFGASLFSYKPSAIVTYSAGQWGGARAAVAMRPFLSELGCLPVSAMIHVPKAHEAVNSDGTFSGDEKKIEGWYDYFSRTLGQLLWWAEASAQHRASNDPQQLIGNFIVDPSQRNAPA